MQDPEEPAQSKPTIIERVERDAFFLLARQKPNIPPDRRRPCPQCGEDAWAQSRWCWNCKWDFDRAALPRIHPTKLLALMLIVNITLVAIVAFRS